MLSSVSGPIQKAGKGEGLFSRRGGITIYERRVATPNPPPPPPSLDPPLNTSNSCTVCGTDACCSFFLRTIPL